MLKFKKFHPVLLVYLFSVTWVVFNSTKQTYGVNDDVILQNWLSGFFTGKPELMIRGSATPRISFGFIVSNLYTYFPDINWFSIILLLVTLLSWFLIGVMAIESKNYFSMITYAIVSILHLAWFIPSPTYTAAAVILSFSSLVFLIKRLQDHKLRRLDLIIVLFYIFSFFIRPESFLLGTAVALPALLYIVLNNLQFVKIKWKLIVGSILVAISFLAIDIYSENLYYKSHPEWKEYKTWEQLRYAIQANTPEELLSQNPGKFGWTEAESELFKYYNTVDASNFNSVKFAKLIEDSRNQQQIDVKKFLNQSHQQIFDGDINGGWNRLIQLITFFFFLFLILSHNTLKKYFTLSILSLLILYLIILYVAGLLRQPERVQVSVIFLAIIINWTSYVFTTEEKNWHVKFDAHTVLSMLIIILIVGSTLPQLQYLKIKVAGAPNVFWQKQILYLSEFPEDSIFVGNASQFRNNWISPYKIEYYEVEERIFTFGWHNFSPHWTKRAKSLGLNPENIFDSVITDDRVYWVSDPESMEYIVEYMNENEYIFDGPNIVGEIEYVGSRYIIWDFNKND